MADQLKTNKEAVIRFNKEVIEKDNDAAAQELFAEGFFNRSAPPGMSTGPDGMLNTFNKILRPAFPDLIVEIHDQVAEGDKVTTRKTIHGVQKGELMGIAPTNRKVSIEVIDIVRLRDGRYLEHWGINNLAAVIASLKV